MTATSRPVSSRPGTDRSDAVRVTREGSTVVITVEGTLDVPEGDVLLREAEAAAAAAPARLEIDLRELEAYTDEGARALVACRTLGAQLAEGLHYRTGRGPGREALLAAYGDNGADFAR